MNSPAEVLYVKRPDGSDKLVKFKCDSMRDVAIIAGYVSACKDHGCSVKFNPDSTWFTLLKDTIKRLRS